MNCNTTHYRANSSSVPGDPTYPFRWSQIVERCGQLGFELMPYYEYKGSKGGAGLGWERRAKRLYGSVPEYTHVPWVETANVDITDPATFEDLRRMLEITVTDESARANFAGVWLRTRVTDFPVSFSDRCLGLFQTQTAQGSTVTRTRLLAEPALYQAYRAWWFEQRKAFLIQVREYLRTNVHSGMDLLFTFDSSESGKSVLGANGSNVITENAAPWSGKGKTYKLLSDALTGQWHRQSLISDWETWGDWEWQHAVPTGDPQRFKTTPGIFQTLSFNRQYTLETNALEAFRAQDGLAMIRHYCLNENAVEVSGNNRLIGYFVADVDYAGPFVVLPEALAVANGDPRYLGYLCSNSFNRGNPGYVRRFNANFLALPGLPSTRQPSLSSDPEMVVRTIPTASNGTYLAVVHTGRVAKTMTLTLPGAGRLVNAVTGEILPTNGTQLALTMDPCELRSFRFFAASSNTPPELVYENEIKGEWFYSLGTNQRWLSLPVSGQVIDYDPGDQVESVSWAVVSGDASKVSFRATDSVNNTVAFSAPGTYVIRITASDGSATRTHDLTFRVATESHRLALTPDMATHLGTGIIASDLFNNQAEAGDPPSANVGSSWNTTGSSFPMEVQLDLKQRQRLTDVWLFDHNGIGTFKVYSGAPGNWTELLSLSTDSYQQWRRYPVDVETRYLKLSRMDGSAIIGEVVLYAKGQGIDTPFFPTRWPVALEVTPQASNQLNMRFNTNAYYRYNLLYSPTLSNGSWQTIQTWNSSQPFWSTTVTRTGASGFYRIQELAE